MGAKQIEASLPNGDVQCMALGPMAWRIQRPTEDKKWSQIRGVGGIVCRRRGTPCMNLELLGPVPEMLCKLRSSDSTRPAPPHLHIMLFLIGRLEHPLSGGKYQPVQIYQNAISVHWETYCLTFSMVFISLFNRPNWIWLFTLQWLRRTWNLIIRSYIVHRMRL